MVSWILIYPVEFITCIVRGICADTPLELITSIRGTCADTPLELITSIRGTCADTPLELITCIRGICADTLLELITWRSWHSNLFNFHMFIQKKGFYSIYRKPARRPVEVPRGVSVYLPSPTVFFRRRL
jgi:hypothetical protein